MDNKKSERYLVHKETLDVLIVKDNDRVWTKDGEFIYSTIEELESTGMWAFIDLSPPNNVMSNSGTTMDGYIINDGDLVYKVVPSLIDTLGVNAIYKEVVTLRTEQDSLYFYRLDAAKDYVIRRIKFLSIDDVVEILDSLSFNHSHISEMVNKLKELYKKGYR